MVSRVLADRYEISQQLGRNAGRRTFLARDLQTGELVVVKLLLFGGDFEWDDLKLFEREAQTLQSLEHRAIPRYLDYFELNSPKAKGFALVQTYISAKSLESYITSGRTFSESELKEISFAILEILAYLHSRTPPVIHRDIKPSNILLGDRTGNSVGQVYLVDFGSVQTLAAREGGTITVVGTYGYMPPEQFGGRAVPASDLYSLGATLIYLATGQHPADLPQKDLQIQFGHLSQLSPAFTSWLKSMTQPSLDDRLTNATEALQALEREQPKGIARLVTQKFANSNLILKKTPEELEILIHCNRSSNEYVFYSLIMSFLSGLLVILVPGQIFKLLSFFCLWILGSLSYKKKMHIDGQNISVILQIFGLKFRTLRVSDRKDIIMLQQVNVEISSNPRTIRSKLIIWAGTQKYEIERFVSRKIEIEREEKHGLAHEVSDWLGIPFTSITKE